MVTMIFENDDDIMIMMLSHVYMHMCIKAPLPLLQVFSPVLSYLPSISRGESPVFSRPLCFVVFPPFSLSQLFPICRFHFLNTSFLLTLRDSSIPVVFAFISLRFSLTLVAMWSLSLFLFLDFLHLSYLHNADVLN